MVCVKVFLENILFSGNAIFRKGKCFHVFGCILKNVSKNIFWCLVVFLKNHRKHIFYLLLTFSRLPNEYIISFILNTKTQTKPRKKKSSNPVKSGHIFSVAKQIYNIIHSSIQKHKKNPEKKKISSNLVKLREEGRDRGN